MWVLVCILIHTYIHNIIYIYTHTEKEMYVYIYIFICTYIYTHIYIFSVVCFFTIDLAQGGCIGLYNWDGGCSNKGKPWGEHLPSDAAVSNIFFSVILLKIIINKFQSDFLEFV